MSTSKSVVAPVVKAIVPLVKGALGAFVKTLVAMCALALVLFAPSYAIASQESVIRGLLACLSAMVFCGVFGWLLAVKRALGTAIMRGLESAQLGARGLEVIMVRLLKFDAEETHGERGRKVAQVTEKIPLTEAETRLKTTVEGLVRAPIEGGGGSGWLKRRITRALFERIEWVTLAAFRDEDRATGGVDLVVVRDKLSTQIDELLLDRVQSTMRTATALLGLASVALTLLAAYGIRHIPL